MINSASRPGWVGDTPGVPSFDVRILTDLSQPAGDSLPFRVDGTITAVDRVSIVILPSLAVSPVDWRPGGHPQLLAWVRRMNGLGAMLCAIGSGVLLLAETGLLDGHEATTHWAYADLFHRRFPGVRLRPDHLLLLYGGTGTIIMTGAYGSWNDLALYLVVRHAGYAAAERVARFLLLRVAGRRAGAVRALHPAPASPGCGDPCRPGLA
ncbi:DJ-1/PfpI family protein [Aquisalimonas sp.]|uniref:DJ-1/PfpI family protein n=1 Tax=Aquisalimonas sp. TaxID=1872621 RepID=UPI0025C12897|nr:DJ-1/PfpI family protein [Aquisalimonas sp.]